MADGSWTPQVAKSEIARNGRDRPVNIFLAKTNDGLGQ